MPASAAVPASAGSLAAVARPQAVAAHYGWVVPDAPWRDAELLTFVKSWPALAAGLPAQLWLPVLDGAHQALNLAASKLRRSGSNAVELAELEHELLLALCEPQVRVKIVRARQSPMGTLAALIDERYRAQRSIPGPSLDDDEVNLDGALRAAGHTGAPADIAQQLAEDASSPLAVAQAELEALLIAQVAAPRLQEAVRRTVELVCGSGSLAESHERALAADIARHVPQLTIAQVLAVISAVLGLRGRRRRTSILGALLVSPGVGRASLTVQYALTRFAREFNRR